MKAKYEIYYVSNPAEALGMPYWAKWAVSLDGDFVDSFRTKGIAEGHVEKWEGLDNQIQPREAEPC
jgi:hypothetical protein